MNKLINYITTTLLNSLLFIFSWHQDESTQHPNITQLQIPEYNINYNHTTLGIDLEFIASKNSNQSLGGVILKSNREHCSNTIYENFIFTDGQQLDKKSHYMVHRLGYQLIQQPNQKYIVYTLLEWLAKKPQKEIHALAFNHPICPAWHYLLTIIYPEGKIQLDRQACNPQSLTWPLNTMIMRYLNQKIVESGNPLEITQKILYFFSINAENQIPQRELNQITIHQLAFIPTQVIHGHTGETRVVTFSPKGKLLVLAGYDRPVQIYNGQTYQLIKTLKRHPVRVFDIIFSPNGLIFASVNYDNTVRIYNATTYKPIKTIRECEHYFVSLAFSADSKQMALTSYKKPARIYNISNDQLLKTFDNYRDWKISNLLSFSPDGKYLVATSYDKTTVQIYNPTNYELLKTLHEHSYKVIQILFSPNSQHLAIISRGAISIYNTTNYHLLQFIPTTPKYRVIHHMAFFPSSNFFALATSGYDVNLYYTKNHQLFKTLKGHTSGISSVTCSPDGRIASSSYDKDIKIWEPNIFFLM